MLTYDLTTTGGALYKSLYENIKNDISSGKLEPNEKLPSKRMLANNLGVSTITVENAYDQLISEGYLYALPKRGYYVADISGIKKIRPVITNDVDIVLPAEEDVWFDFSSNRTSAGDFPFSVWARLMRETISMREEELLQVSPCGGVEELREAIANYLTSFRGMQVSANQIIVGAGTEYLYGLLIKLLGRDRLYCVENPGYKKIRQIYESNYARCTLAEIDRQGMSVEALRKTGADIAHISPTHHFPTGITTPVSRRYELLAWANEKEGRYIIEDDYDSEFRLKGRPIPPLMSLDACEKVIYMNTFSKSLTSTIRISYMVLPEHLVNEFYRRLGFYSCTVSTFEQYTLAAFISQGFFEKHINRMRLHYGRRRNAILDIIRKHWKEEECRIVENDSGLHFIMEFNTELTDSYIEEGLMAEGIKIRAVTSFDMSKKKVDKHQFILNYSNIDMDKLDKALDILAKFLAKVLDR
ncbi:MAG: PLP-dependent aminotransferase family protein [Wujia sp.]